MFYKRWRWYLVNLITLSVNNRISGLDPFILGKNWPKRDYLGSFALEGGGESSIPICICQNIDKKNFFCEHQKCSLGPKKQNKHLIFFGQMVPKKGCGSTQFGTNSQIIWYFFPISIILSVCFLLVSLCRRVPPEFLRSLFTYGLIPHPL